MSPPPRSNIPRFDDLDLVVETPRLRLRPLVEGDVEDLWPYVSNPELPRQMSWAAHTDRSQTREFIASQLEGYNSGTELTWAIEHDDKAVGCIGLHAISWQFRAWRVDRAELGYWIAPDLWRQGLMTEAAHAAVRFGFDALGLHKITVGCILENEGSRRVIEKLGFRFMGKYEEHIWRDGRWWAYLKYELTTTEWSDVSTTMRVSRFPPT